jgi:hypothetical protein
MTRQPGTPCRGRNRSLARAGVPVALALCAALPPAGPAGAQQPTPIRLGETVSATLTQADPVMTDKGAFRVYQLEAREGARLVATLRSGAFDAFLTLMRPVAGINEVVASDDDSGGGTDARVRWVVPATGTYHLVAQALGPEERGGFTLVVEEAAAPRAAVPQAITPGQALSGTLDERSPFLHEGNGDVFYHLYGFEGRAGQQLAIELESSEFDTFLAFGPLAGDVVEVTSSNDDSGGTSNSRLRVSLAADGRYGIQARALTADVLGSYTITLREVEIAPPRALMPNQEVASTLADGDVDLQNRPFEAWTYSGTAGETVGIRMRSSDFDAYLVLGRMVAGNFETLIENDDESDESTDAVLLFTLPSAGEYLIRAASFGTEAAGAYTLRLDSMGR